MIMDGFSGKASIVGDRVSITRVEPSQLLVTLQPGFAVCHTTAECLDAIDSPKVFPGDSEFLHLNCQLDGMFEGSVCGLRLTYGRGDISLGFSAGESFCVRHCERFQNVTVMVTPQALCELVGEEACPFLAANDDPGFFVRCAGACRRTLRSAINIAALLAESPHRRLLLHAAALDYLHWQLSAFQLCNDGKAPSPRERRQLEDARTLLLQDLSSPPTIADLARAVGLNQCKLKAGFKQLFGSSIYALFQEERMNNAVRLLQAHNVTETAVILGYTNISHFSAAFQKQFGYLPSRARRQVCGVIPQTDLTQTCA